jgi:hypothetical protein
VAAAKTAAGDVSSDGARQPWIVVWRRGVNGSRLWERLCPSMSLPAEPPAGVTGPPRTAVKGGAMAGSAAFDVQPQGAAAAWDAATPLIPCLARYDTLLNGFSGTAG